MVPAVPDHASAAFPGKPFGDGPDGHSLWPSFTNVPNEFLESYFPLRIDIYETIADTGGAGKNRGGNGLRIGYRFLEPGEISIHDDRWLTYPWGVNGGLPGARSKKTLVRTDGSEELLPSKIDRIKVEAGDLLLSDTWGGGGCGDPFEREVEKVVFDVQAGLVTPQGAPQLRRRDQGRPDGRRRRPPEKLRAQAARPSAAPVQAVRSRLRVDRRAEGALQGRDGPRAAAAAAVLGAGAASRATAGGKAKSKVA